MSQYERIKEELLRTGRLFEDRDFPASRRSIRNDGQASSAIRWRRPPVSPPKLLPGIVGRVRYLGGGEGRGKFEKSGKNGVGLGEVQPESESSSHIAGKCWDHG